LRKETKIAIKEINPRCATKFDENLHPNQNTIKKKV
jgi:hypothetical protein